MKIVDMHCDTFGKLLDQRDNGVYAALAENDGHIDLEKLRQGGYLLQNFAMYVDLAKCEDPWERVQRIYALYREELERNSDRIAPVYKYEDIERNRAEGKLSALLAVEEGGVCKGEISKLCQLYEQGVRMMTLTWNYPNEIGFPNINDLDRERIRKEISGLTMTEQIKRIWEYSSTPDLSNGLTKKGREFLHKMEELGVIVDVSHLSDAGFYQVLECTEKPFVASHSDARALCSHVRNMSDDMIRKLAERGGVMGLNYEASFLASPTEAGSEPRTVEHIVQHARHIVGVGGIECLGLGSDFDGISATNEDFPHAGCMNLLFEGLKKGGFTESQIDKIFGENVLRVYWEVL